MTLPPGHINDTSNSMKLNLYVYQFQQPKIDQRSVLLNGIRITPANTAKYHGMSFHLMPSSTGRRKSRRNKGNRKSNSKKCTGCSDADPDCQCTISCCYINKCFDQYGHTVPNYGDMRKKAISTEYRGIRIKH
jgi:hypothetical protein